MNINISADSAESTSGGPAIHLLVIGVGDYPHLNPSGTQWLSNSLGSLTSPAVSALWFADQLSKLPGEEWEAPLAPPIVLTSSPGKNEHATTREQIQKAFNTWLDRCASHPDNIAMFYFCGHGVQSDDHLLLASDFARDSRNRFDGAFNIDRTRRALAHTGPATQCFIIDACRMPIPTGELCQTNTVRPLLQDYPRIRRGTQHSLTLSLSLGEESTANPNEVSNFTRAVTAAFAGHAAERDGLTGTWVISDQSISTAIGAILQETVGTTVTAPDVEVGRTGKLRVLRRLRMPPTGTLSLSCVPGRAQAAAHLSCEPIEPPGPRVSRDTPDSLPWRVLVTAGHHRVQAEFTEETFTDTSALEFVVPPVYRRKLRVKP